MPTMFTQIVTHMGPTCAPYGHAPQEVISYNLKGTGYV